MLRKAMTRRRTAPTAPTTPTTGVSSSIEILLYILCTGQIHYRLPSLGVVHVRLQFMCVSETLMIGIENYIIIPNNSSKLPAVIGILFTKASPSSKYKHDQ